MDCFPLEGFKHVTNNGVLICYLFVWSGWSRCSVFWEYPVYLNMVSENLWRAAFDFDQDLEPVLPKLLKGFWFYILCAFLSCGSYSIASGALFPLGNIFRFIENCFHLFQKHPFRKIWMYNVTVMDLFFLNLSYLISFIIRYFLFYSRTVVSLDCVCFLSCTLRDHGEIETVRESFFPFFSATYALCRAPCAIIENQKRREKLKTYTFWVR